MATKTDPRIESKITELRREAKEYLCRRKFEEALGCLETAIELNHSSYKLYRLRAITLSCLQDFERSAEDASRVIELAPHIMDGYYHKGFALFHLKHYTEAARAFQQGLALNPTDRTLRQGFWDSINLLSQSRTNSGQLVHEAELELSSTSPNDETRRGKQKLVLQTLADENWENEKLNTPLSEVSKAGLPPRKVSVGGSLANAAALADAAAAAAALTLSKATAQARRSSGGAAAAAAVVRSKATTPLTPSSSAPPPQPQPQQSMKQRQQTPPAAAQEPAPQTTESTTPEQGTEVQPNTEVAA